MADEPKTPKTFEELETEIVGLKIRLKRVEDFLHDFPNVEEYLGNANPGDLSDDDELLEKATEIVTQYDRASASLLQRRLAIGYARAARLIDQLEAKGVISSSDGSSEPRTVLVQKEE